MNKIKFIPALAMVALLSACGTSSPSVKQPKFAKKGEEVTAEKFAETVNPVIEGLDLTKNEALGSKKIVAKQGAANTAELKRNGEVFSSLSTTSVNEGAMEYDADNRMMSRNVKTSLVAVSKGKGREVKQTSSTNYKSQVQKASLESDLYIAEVDADNKIITYIDNVEDDAAYEKAIDESVKGAVYSLINMNLVTSFLAGYSLMPEEELAKYTTYVNGNTYTVDYGYEEEEESKSSSDEVVSVTKTVVTQTSQYTVKGNDVTFKFFEERVETTEFKLTSFVNHEYYFGGDVYEEKNTRTAEVTYKDAKVSLKVIDTTGFTVGEDD